MSGPDSSPEAIPQAEIRPRRRIPLVWTIPLVAALVAVWLAYTTLTEKGPTITITFKTAAGLEAGKTKVKYKQVELGMVDAITISEDLSNVIVTASLSKEAEPHLAETTRFWVVRPRLGIGGVSGLDTLVSGAYIEIDPGRGKPAREFKGLETPPVVRSSEPGREFVLSAARLGSLSAGSPVYFRGIEVGEVMGYRLTEDNEDLRIRVFVRAPYHELVRDNSRFWNATGIEVTLDADGVKVSTESLQALIAGGIAFDSPTGLAGTAPAKHGVVFTLHKDFASIGELAYTRKVGFMAQFEGSVRGLRVGAPVEFRGIKIGSVTDVRAEFDRETLEIRIPVALEIEPDRLQSVRGPFEDHYKAMELLVERGLRAQLVAGNLLTGQLVVSLAIHADSEPARLAYGGPFPEIPTIPSRVDQITSSVAGVLTKIASLPLAELIGDLRQTVQSTDRLVSSRELADAVVSLQKALAGFERLVATTDDQIAPLMSGMIGAAASAQSAMTQAQATLAEAQDLIASDSRVVYGLGELLDELTDAARSIRNLTDFLEAHPEALLRGKSGRDGR